MTASRLRLAAYLIYAVHVTAFLVAEWVSAGQLGAPIDDGWIYLAFAQALAEGEGLTYPGYDGALCAVTGPIWNAIQAVFLWLFGPSIVVAKVVGILTGALAIRGVERLGSVATGDAKIGALAALLLAATARFVWGAISVMEVPFFIATVAFGLAMHLERRDASLRRWLPALVVTWLSGWARPECFVFTLFVALDRWRLRDLGIACALLGLYPAYHLLAYGHALPTTFYAKAAGGAPWSILARDGVLAALSALVQRPIEQLGKFVSYLPTFAPALMLGFVPALLRARRERQRAVLTVAWMMVGFIVARGALGVTPPQFQYGRYFGHVYALFAVVCLYGFDAERRSRAVDWVMTLLVGGLLVLAWDPTAAYAFDWISSTRVSLDGAYAVLYGSIGLGVVLLIWGGIARPGLPAAWSIGLYLLVASGFGVVRSGWNVRDTYALNVAMAEKVREIVPVGEVVACHDIGALGYFAERPLLDLAGLGSPEVVFGPRRPDGGIDAQAVLAEYQPRWLCLTLAMSAQVFGGGEGMPEGMIPGKKHAEIVHPANVTLLGDTYILMELHWAE